MSDALLAIVMAECKGPIERCSGGLEEKLRVSLKVAKNHCMVLNPDIQLRGAVGAVMSHYGKDSEEWRRLESEVAMLRKVSAMLMASEAGLSVSVPDEYDEPKHKPVGIMKMWHEVAK